MIPLDDFFCAFCLLSVLVVHSLRFLAAICARLAAFCVRFAGLVGRALICVRFLFFARVLLGKCKKYKKSCTNESPGRDQKGSPKRFKFFYWLSKRLATLQVLALQLRSLGKSSELVATFEQVR